MTPAAPDEANRLMGLGPDCSQMQKDAEMIAWCESRAEGAENSAAMHRRYADAAVQAQYGGAEKHYAALHEQEARMLRAIAARLREGRT